MQEARPEAEAGGDALPVAHARDAIVCKRASCAGVHLDVGQQREVVAGAAARSRWARRYPASVGRRRGFAAERRAFAASVKSLMPLVLEERRLGGQASRSSRIPWSVARRDLAGLDVRLVEGLMPMTEPATAVAISQRKNSSAEIVDVAPRRCGRRAGRPAPARRRRRPARRPARIPVAGRRTRDRCRRRRAAPSGSRSTGMMPLPCLPVDSAISCSSQAPRSWMPGEAMSVSLSRPRAAQPAEDHAQHDAGVLARQARSARRRRPSARRASRTRPTSRPMTAAGTMPKFESAE